MFRLGIGLTRIIPFYRIPIQKPKPKKHYAGIGAIIFTFTVLSIVIALSIYTAWQIAYGQSAFLGGFSVYNNTDYGFKVLYPQNWLTVEGDTRAGDYITDIIRFEPSDEQGKHFSKKYPSGEVCFMMWIDNRLELQGLNLEQYSDNIYNQAKNDIGTKVIDFKQGIKLGDKNAFELLFKQKQGNREYIQKQIATPYGDNFIYLIFKSRTKYSNEVLPLANTVINSFQFIGNNTK